LLVNEQVHFLGVNLREEIDEVGEGPAQAIDGPYHYHIELSADGALPQRIEGGPLFPAFGAADPLINELLNNLPAIPFGHYPKLPELVVHSLTVGRHSPIDGGSRDSLFHRGSSISMTHVF
jgi:hypothetical protein